MPRIEVASPAQMPLVRTLFAEYADSLPFDLGFQNFEKELASLPGDYLCIFLAWKGEEIAGCAALRQLGERVAEMKRLYVRRGFQGQGVGRALCEAVLAEARARGFTRVRLDTTPTMRAAITMYERLGFTRIAPYRENPVAGATYWEKVL